MTSINFFYTEKTLLESNNLQILYDSNINDTIKLSDEILKKIDCNKLLPFNSKSSNIYSVKELKDFCKSLGIKYTNKKDIVDKLRDYKHCP